MNSNELSFYIKKDQENAIDRSKNTHYNIFKFHLPAETDFGHNRVKPVVRKRQICKCSDKEEYTARRCTERRRMVQVFVRELWK